MIVKLLFLLNICYLVFAPWQNQKVEDDSKMIEGAWIPVVAELGGKPLPQEFLKDTKLVLADGNYTYINDHGTYKIIPAETPKAMDITGKEGPNQGKTLLAIYELTGDTLRICYDLEGKTRPSEFATKAETQQLLVSYKRAKP